MGKTVDGGLYPAAVGLSGDGVDALSGRRAFTARIRYNRRQFVPCSAALRSGLTLSL
ncbi:hypothetical protein ACUN8C_11565 [Kushneria sp. Sum13]|uniref:hypothetical protein n=1 Tax=Kushneria sp. Sum13 TaxID=3459196 RepID=UPI0040456649